MPQLLSDTNDCCLCQLAVNTKSTACPVEGGKMEDEEVGEALKSIFSHPVKLTTTLHQEQVSTRIPV